MLLILACNGNPILPKNTIKISSNRMHNNLILSERHYVKQQQPREYILHGHSETFVKLPSLTMPFYHTQPLLYKIRFEGKCYSPHSKSIWLYLHLMIDDYILYVDKFLPNTANRYQYLPGFTDNYGVDTIGGFAWFATSPTTVMCTFSDIIYLNAGLHVIDVGVRGGIDSTTHGAFPIYVGYGILTIELVEYDPQADIGILPVNVTLTSLIG
jgi:hypothetical protein